MRFPRKGRIGAFGLLLVLCVLAALPAGATDRVTRLHRRQHRVDTAHHHLQNEIRATERAQTGLLARIASLDSTRGKTEAQLRALNTRIRVLDSKIAATRSRLQVAARRLRSITARLQSILRRLDARTTAFTARAVASYEAGPTAGLETLLSSRSFGDLFNRYAYYQSAMTADAQLIAQIQRLSQATSDHRSGAASQRNAILATKRKLDDQRRALAQQRRRRRSALSSLRQVIAAKHRAIHEIEHRRAQLQAAIAENDRESAQVAALLQAAQGDAGGHPAGQLLWPVFGPITSGFGWRIYPLFHTREFHPGIDIAAPYGAPVKAAAAGVVDFAGTMTGYGNVLVIDHGGGLATLYGHLSAYSVSQGQQVARGAPIANVGCTGWCTGPHLHFEVRLSGRPVDPMPYLK